MLLLERGKLVPKAHAAELLWPDTDPARGMDNLYKVCGAIRGIIKKGIAIPFEIRRSALWLDAEGIDSDIAQFERLYRNREEIACCKAAIELYTAPFAASECYEWSSRAEAYYDMRYLELLGLARRYSADTGDKTAAQYYERLMKEFS